MAYCTDCGTEYTNGQKFCGSCGTHLQTEETPDGNTREVADGGQTVMHGTEVTSAEEISADATTPSSVSREETREIDVGDAIIEVHTGTEQKLVVGGAILIVLGAFLPWATVFGISIAGIDGDGSLTLLMGLVAGVVALVRPWSRNVRIGTVLLGSLVALVALADMTSVAGIGIYMTLIGGLLVLYPGAREAYRTYSTTESA